MAASVVSTRLVKILEPTLEANGFTRRGKTFIRTEGNLNGVIDFLSLPRQGDGVTRFAVSWGVTLPGVVARFGVGPNDVDTSYAALGDQLLPPRKYYYGLFPRERETHPVWGIPGESREAAQECADAVLKGLKKDALPIILELLKPGALREEIYTKKDDRRIRLSAAWWADGINLLIEDAPVEEVRALLSHADNTAGEYYAWADQRLREREKEERG
jgi:hypothetical protein